MKLRVILTVLFIFPILVNGQSDVIFYSEAPMYVKYKEGVSESEKGTSASTTLYIEGSVKFATGSSIEQKGRTEITKDFIKAKDPKQNEAVGANLFVNKTAADAFGRVAATDKEGVVAFIGKGEDGTSTLQRIYGVIPEGSTATIDEQKEKNWIDFPTIAVEKGKPTKNTEDWRDVGYLKVDVTGSLSVDYIKAMYGDRFAVDMRYEQDPTVAEVSPRIIKSGYARIKDVASTMEEKDKATYSQVNLSLYKYDETSGADDGAFVKNSEGIPVADPNTYTHGEGTLRNSSGWNYLTGFTTPFQSLGADYMFYHALTKPHGSSITSYEGPIVDPYRKMENGVGYFMSMEVSHNDHDVINKRWDFPAFGGFDCI